MKKVFLFPLFFRFDFILTDPDMNLNYYQDPNPNLLEK